ncbi:MULTISPECIES: RepB family plasmid replication initiator protein [Lactococcus]|uniref:RepB family plasmid replication initiator protein n=1 Tax=Lactococcus TaxID=1357 RepID=UPI001A8F28FD|nr:MULTISPECIES: RepB family plasmid replication initiator protein [Lactococcus]MDT2563348.1 RepB family plasmid replication initiator protein [Lactococcus petauri]QSR03141.1 RepB family plasmid replication initiator protein [Lactococcus sp. LG1074]QUW40290.1 hypothetical protein [Lactococcus garvieae]
MNDLEKRNVVEHNDLITSVAKMDKVPLKIFEMAVSYIDTENPPEDNIVYLSKQELFDFFDVSDSNKHSRFKEAIEKMQKQAFFQIKEEKKRGFKFKSIVPIPFVEWNDYNSQVIIRFDQAIMPYLIDLKTNFTQYAITDIMELNSKYSIIFYKLLTKSYNQYEHYQYKSNRTKKQLLEYRNPQYSILELREITDTLDEYKHSSNFFKRVIDEPLKEINDNTHFNVTYEKVKKGRSIDSIIFHIDKKIILTDNDYKKEQDDPEYLESKEKQSIDDAEYFKLSMESKYTRLLIENSLLNPMEMTDISLMVGLQKNVYPLYQELEKIKGDNGLLVHLQYVQDKQEGYTKRNTAKYLKKAVESYLSSIMQKENLGVHK